MPARPDAVIFDLGGVLVGVDFARQREKLGIHCDARAAPWTALGDDLMRRWCTGGIGEESFRRAMCERRGHDLDASTFAAWWSDIFFPIEGMDAVVRALAPAVRLGLLSDTDPIHWRVETAAHPFLGLVPRPTLSFVTGVLKPDPAAFLAASRDVGVPPGRCLFVDDVERNVEGARRAGMQAVRFEGRDALLETLAAMGLPVPETFTRRPE